MNILKKIARKLILPLSVGVGLDKYYLKKSNTNCAIINFHGVRKNNNITFNNRHIEVKEFEKIISYLNKKYNITSLSELFEIHRNKTKTSKKTIALTFDDGYKNNFDIALPILKKYNTPATFYIITKGLNEDFLVWPDIIDIIKKYHKSDITVNNYVFKHPTFYCNEVNSELLNYLKTCGTKTEELVKTLNANFDYVTTEKQNQPELCKLITKEDFVKYANESLIEYGSHTHTHFNLEYLNDEDTRIELLESKKILEDIIGKKVTSLAFPDGSYTNQTNKIALELGYNNLVAVEYKFNENNTNLNLLSRFTISNSTTFESNMLRLAKDFDKYGF